MPTKKRTNQVSDSLMSESLRKKAFAAQQEKIGMALVKKGMGDKPMGTRYVDNEFKSVPTGKQRLEIAKKARQSASADSAKAIKYKKSGYGRIDF